MLVMHYIERSCLDGAISYSRSLHAIGPLDIGDRGVGQNILLFKVGHNYLTERQGIV